MLGAGPGDVGAVNSRSAITVVIVGNVRLYREGLAGALASRDEIEVVGALECNASLIGEVVAGDTDVVLIDVAGRGSLDLARALRVKCPHVKLVAFAVEEQEPGLIRFAEAGVAAYVTCDASLEDVAKIVRSVTLGQFVCPPSLTATLLRTLALRGESENLVFNDEKLTQREAQVLRLIRDGLSNKEIAQAFNISEATVKNHVHHLLEKLHVSSRHEAAARAQRVADR